MKKLNEILFITEDLSENKTKWVLSWKRPDFQVEKEYESEEISKEDALKLLSVINNQTNTIQIGDKIEYNVIQ